MKKTVIFLIFWLTARMLMAQAGHAQAYAWLRLPLSAHVGAVGGENISLVDDDASLGLANPALLANVQNRTLRFDYTRHMASANLVGAQYVQAFGERHTGSVALHYLGYGRQDETDASGNVLGHFTPKDIMVQAGYAYLLSSRWSGGAALKVIYAHYAGYTSAALAVDVGVNYYNDETDLSFSAALRNVGVQVKRFDDRSERVPYDVQLGLSKGLDHAPIRFSFTLTDLTRWRSSYYYSASGRTKPLQVALNHLVAGVDIVPSSHFYLSAGYNFRRAYELKAAGRARGAGITVGGGVRLGSFKADVAWGRYSAAASDLSMSVAWSL